MAGLRPERLEDADRLIPYSEGIALWHAILELLPNAHVGLVMGRIISLQRSGILGCAIAHLDTLGDALAFLQRYQQLADNSSHVLLERRADVAVLRLEVHPVLGHLAQPVEGMAAGVHLVAQALSGHPLPVTRVTFAHASSLATEPYREIFGIDPLFGQPRTALIYPIWTLDLPVRNAQRSLARYLVAYAADRLAHLVLPRPGLTARVRSWIADCLDDHRAPLQDEAAEAMGMSTRQLQRQLAAENTAFRELADELRQRRAQVLLRDADTSVEEVAHKLGYGDPRSFYRACRRWTGRSPRDLRHQFREDQLRKQL